MQCDHADCCAVLPWCGTLERMGATGRHIINLITKFDRADQIACSIFKTAPSLINPVPGHRPRRLGVPADAIFKKTPTVKASL